MHNLPYELAEDILRRLPVKSLKRFRAVERSWCSLIDSERFAKLHLKWSLDTNSRPHLILSSIYSIFHINLDNAYLVESPLRQFNNPFPIACNGLVLVHPPALWNPFTRDYKVLPAGINHSREYNKLLSVCYGLAYDSLKYDYKVVRVMCYSGVKFLSVEVYSLKSSRWTKVQGFLAAYFLMEFHVHVKGALHGRFQGTVDDVAIANCPVEIMAFNVETEMHYKLKLPDIISMKSVHGTSLSTIGGCLSVSYCECNGTKIDIWVMMEYGVIKSWQKLVAISYEMPLVRVASAKTLFYSKDGNKVLLICNDARLVWCDLRKNTLENVIVNAGLRFALAYVESLVSLNGNVGDVIERERVAPYTVRKLRGGVLKSRKDVVEF